MDVATRISGDTLYVKISGPVDTPAAEILRTELNKIASQKPQKVVMDLSTVPTMGSSGIGKILMFFKSLDGAKASFEIKGIHENLFNIFKAVKLDKLFPISLR
ncbi:MAG TPA: STAS domain-containing protein [Deltaproteobacteria bacterium]|jgi:anti-anti-sigma factor|nr:STAS domain-containing protein [Deltaproteobacteria bacterium]HRW80448.1 STAS domain-containing protein [Desulfomonilia bacterium]HNQ85407.1 STAS domain-containing protein [Deltaproteobacteria bacterium]HNS89663.1 STAS domain-containing protein [Deltaproteobacteria bacterium]HOA44708.1 STAS domain-containing protein [Deltaproteobacteria bacterium]